MWHGLVIEYLIAKGYKSNPDGVCYGLSNMGMQAILSKDVETYNNRFQTIKDDKDNGYKLTDFELNQRGVTAFLSGVDIYFQPQKYSHLYEETQEPSGQETVQSAKILASVEIEKQGGLTDIDHFTGVYSMNDLVLYLESLKDAIKSTDPPFTEPVAITLHTAKHAMTIGFDPQKSQWVFINSAPAKYMDNERELAAAIMAGFGVNSINQKLIIGSEIYATKQNEKANKQIVEKWIASDKWQSVHTALDDKVLHQDFQKHTWLTFAALENDTHNIMKILENEKTDPNVKNENRDTALHIAARYGHIGVLTKLMGHPKINSKIFATSGTPFEVAIINKQYRAAEQILRLSKNTKYGNGDTQLHHFVAKGDNKWLEFLLKENVDPNQKNNEGGTPLHCALEKKNQVAVELLLKNGAKPNLATSGDDEVTPLMIACRMRDYKSAKILLSYGADPNLLINGRTALDEAKADNREDLVHLLEHPPQLQHTIQRPPASYCFAQQINSSCHVMPFINLAILHTIRAKSTQALEKEGVDAIPFINLQNDAKWHSKRSWLPQTFLWTKTWDQAISQAMETPFGDYQRHVLQNGVLQGHVYDAQGTHLLNTWNPAEYYARLILTPFNFTDANMLSGPYRDEHAFSALKTLPLFYNKGKGICYDPAKQDYVQMLESNQKDGWDVALYVPPQEAGWVETAQSYYNRLTGSEENEDKPKGEYRYYKLTDAQKQFLNLPPKTYLNGFQNSVLGYEVGYKHLYLPEQSKTNAFYMSSLLQLMLLCMGVDRNNQDITPAHPLYDQHKALQQCMQASQTNPWALQSFNKENLFEYHLAKLIQKNPALKEKMKQTVNIFFASTWQYYQDLDNMFDSPDPNTRNSLKDKKNFLLGEDLYLAYAFMANARWLWGASTSREAFNAILELDPLLAQMMRLPLVPGPNQLIRNAQAKNEQGDSFLDVWEEIRKAVMEDESIPKELASFSGHGVVMSFYPDLLEQQMKNGAVYPQVMDRLGFSVIDSYYGEQLSPIYRDAKGKESTAICNLSKLTQADLPAVAEEPATSARKTPLTFKEQKAVEPVIVKPKPDKKKQTPRK